MRLSASGAITAAPAAAKPKTLYYDGKTVAGNSLSFAIQGKRIFDIDGVGQWGLRALGTPSDIPVVTATVLVAAFFIIASNLIVDLVYSILDPRVRLV